MDDRFLHEARREPSREFARELKTKLEAGGEAGPAWAGARGRAGGPGRTWLAGPLAPVLAGTVALAAVVGLFTLPSVRASAQAFLDLFRVRNFTAVSVAPARLEQFRSGAIDLKSLLGDHIETLKDPGPRQIFSDPQAAGIAAGIAVLTPAVLPAGLAVDTIYVQGEGEARLTVDLEKLRQVVEAAGVTDVSLPPALYGAQVSVRMPPAVGIRYRARWGEVGLLEARSPEVSLPPGMDLVQLGEIGLRVVGLSQGEAHRLAQSIDWHSTVLVPLPANATSFRDVDVRGHKALLVTATGDFPAAGGGAGPPRASGGGANDHRGPWARDAAPHRARWHTILLWSEGGMVYALTGTLDRLNLVEMANSLH